MTAWFKWAALLAILILIAGLAVGFYPKFLKVEGLPRPLVAALGKNIQVGGVSITPLELVEDSRCPVDVQCIQAGTVRVRVALNALNRDFIFKLGELQVVGDHAITLSGVTPATKYSKVTVPPSDYRFTFTVTKASPVASGIRGTVSLGPTCPVMRNPPDPACADKPYATKLVLSTADGSRVVSEFSSSAEGGFSIAIKPGTYAIRSAALANILPRCASNGTITVTSGTYTTALVSCDTGIR